MFYRILSIVLLSLLLNGLTAQSTIVKSETVLTGKVYFDFGKHDIRPDADSTLSAIKDFITEKEGLQIEITAHTDSIGSLENNLTLSQRRSESVKLALEAMGVPDSLMLISDYGETQPDATNSTDEGRQTNRRATIKIIKQPPITILEGVVMDAKSGRTLVSMVVVRNKEWRDTIYTDSTGYFSKTLPLKLVVGVDAYADCHFFGSQMTKSRKNMQPLAFKLDPVITGESFALDNLYFVGNQAVLLPKSKPELPKLLRFMEGNPKMKIEIAGHINLPNLPPVEKNTWHYALSHNRAKTVYKYLVENGISPDRISYKGYGNWEMKFPRATEEKQMALNRRVEMKVLEGGCEL